LALSAVKSGLPSPEQVKEADQGRGMRLGWHDIGKLASNIGLTSSCETTEEVERAEAEFAGSVIDFVLRNQERLREVGLLDCEVVGRGLEEMPNGGVYKAMQTGKSGREAEAAKAIPGRYSWLTTRQAADRFFRGKSGRAAVAVNLRSEESEALDALDDEFDL
jgi:hypothetical protein